MFVKFVQDGVMKSLKTSRGPAVWINKSAKTTDVDDLDKHAAAKKVLERQFLYGRLIKVREDRCESRINPISEKSLLEVYGPSVSQ